jgi:hypothetical protein
MQTQNPHLMLDAGDPIRLSSAKCGPYHVVGKGSKIPQTDLKGGWSRVERSGFRKGQHI